MSESEYLSRILMRFPNVKRNKIKTSSLPSGQVNFQKLCRLLSENGRILEIDDAHPHCIAAICAPSNSLNEGVAAVSLRGETLYLAAYAKEGLIKQHTAEKIIQKIMELVK